MPREVPPALRIALMVAGAAIVLLCAAVVLERVLWRGQPLPGVTLTGVQLAGAEPDEIIRAITTTAQRYETSALVARAGEDTVEIFPEAFGLDVDEGATYEAVLAAGRAGGPTGWLTSVLDRRTGGIEVAWQVRRDDALLDAGSKAVAEQVDREPQNGRLSFEGGTVRPAAPQPGRQVNTAELSEAVAAAFIRQGPRDLTIPTTVLEPVVGDVAVDEVAARAQELLSGPVQVNLEGSVVALEPAELATAMSAEPVEGVLDLQIDPAALHEVLRPKVAARERAPTDATFAIDGNGVHVVASVDGRAVDTEALAQAILAGERQPAAGFRPVEPGLTTEAAQDLGIQEPISTFTSAYQPGQPRVDNIQRAAELLQNTVILPGDQFSMNGRLGPRTLARGFVEAPVIYEGRFEEDVGGGISQMATTLFNAAFFAGIPIDQHKAHSYYISRYPMGREATVSLPAPDLVFTNDLEHGILVRTRATETEVTVTFYSTHDGRDVTATEPVVLATREPEVEEVTDPEDVSSGRQGFDVEVFRLIEIPGQEPRRERFFTQYLAEPVRVLAT